MGDANHDQLPPGVHILDCDGRPVPVTKDPGTMTAEEKHRVCNGGLSAFIAKNLDVFRDVLGNIKVRPKPQD